MVRVAPDVVRQVAILHKRRYHVDVTICFVYSHEGENMGMFEEDPNCSLAFEFL